MRSISAADDARRLEGAKRAAQQQRHRRCAKCRSPKGRENDPHAQGVERVLEIGGRGSDNDRAARGGPAHVGERRDVETNPVTRLRRVGERRNARADHPLRERGSGKYAATETERAGDQPPSPVEHLHARIGATQGRLECTRGRQQRGRRSAQLRDGDSTAMQRAVQRVTEMTLDGYVDGDPERDDREQDRQRCRDHRPAADRQPAHAPSTNPTPRTVLISGGSPSLRRR